jgi:hypothetical protein
MNKPMSDSYKEEVDQFKKWADNSLGRCEDFCKGISPRARYERPYEPLMSPALQDIIDNTFNYASNGRK